MPSEGLSLKGQPALVTGSGRGIGAALARGLAQAAADVAVSDPPDRPRPAARRQTPGGAGGRRSAGTLR